MLNAVCRSLALLILIVASTPVVGAQYFQLQIDDVSGLDEPWPLVGGLPFAEGELWDASQIRIVRGDGVEVAAQIDITATWRDGSIRWALASFTASPQADYRVEYGPDVSRTAPSEPLTVTAHDDGSLSVATGAAVYRFAADRLLPDSGRMDNTVFLADAGDGAYLVDNKGRLSRVAGEQAAIETQILKEGPMRTVIRRAGWYVTADGERVARAKAWFYFAAGVPYLRVTHTLVFTEDTNEIWVKDYGLEFRTPGQPRQVMFAHRQAEAAEKLDALTGSASWDAISPEQSQALVRLFSGEVERDWTHSDIAPQGDEVYMLQDRYPHFLERDFWAVIGRGDPGSLSERFKHDNNVWVEPWEKAVDVAGDWGDGHYDDFALAVVVPWMAQQFPKEIAFSPQGARVALWSSRSGRELDFRAETLVREYWQEWATGTWRGEPRAPGGPTALASMSSNAQGAARTHDVWLLPRPGAQTDQGLDARKMAVSNPPLLQVDPVRLAATGAIGWPVHPRDVERFPEQEALIDGYWEPLRRAYVQLRHTGFIEWGKNHTLRHAKSQFFRQTRLIDYGLRRHVWALYGRSGQRSYWEYGSRFNRFAGDWELSHWTAGNRIRGMFVDGVNTYPFHWGERSSPEHHSGHGPTGHTIAHWLLEYYMTGDEYPLDLTRMVGDAYLNAWDPEEHVYTQSLNELQILAWLYSREWNEDFRTLARYRAERKIDLECPLGISDSIRNGPIYKTGRDLQSLYDYYTFTGDVTARQAFLKAVDYKYRFNLIRQPFDGQNYIGFVFSVAYKWTGNPNYLRVVNAQLEAGKRIAEPRSGVTSNQHPTLSIPAALTVMAEVDEPIEPFPVLSWDGQEHAAPIVFGKAAGHAVEIRLYLRMIDHHREPELRIRQVAPKDNAGTVAGVHVEKEFAFQPSSGYRLKPGDWHVRVIIPPDATAGNYLLEIPRAETVVVLDSTASNMRLANE